MTTMLDWWTFAQDAPTLARDGWHLLRPATDSRQRGSVLLATTRSDGGPRLQPCQPLLDDGRLYLLLDDGTAAARDLRRDGRFGVRARSPYRPVDEDDARNDAQPQSPDAAEASPNREFRIEGTARLETDAALQARIAEQFDPQRAASGVLFELMLEQVSLGHRAPERAADAGDAQHRTTDQIRWRCLGRRACA